MRNASAGMHEMFHTRRILTTRHVCGPLPVGVTNHFVRGTNYSSASAWARRETIAALQSKQVAQAEVLVSHMKHTHT